MRHALQGIGIGAILRFNVRTRVDVGRRTEALGDGGQRHAFREQRTVAVVEGVHKLSLFGLCRFSCWFSRRLGLYGQWSAFFRQEQWAFLAAASEQCAQGNHSEKGSK